LQSISGKAFKSGFQIHTDGLSVKYPKEKEDAEIVYLDTKGY